MAILEEDIARVRQATDLVEVVQEHVALRKAGRRWSGLCPFHAEKSPSFSVNAEEGLFYCLAGETRVITWDGIREIRELAGGTHKILTEKGQWTEAPFYSFGVQPLMKITLTRNRQTKEIFATPEHRWFVRGKGTHRYERTTQELRKGQPLSWSFPSNRVLAMGDLSPFGIAHGITYGDGTKFNSMVSVDLHGSKDAQLLKYFPLNRTYDLKTAAGKPYVKVLDLPYFFKERPSLDEAPTYLAGWLAGYLAADGHVAKDGTVMLNSANRQDLEFVRDVCTRLGIGTYGITSQRRVGINAVDSSLLYRLHFITEDMDERFFVLDEHHFRFFSNSKEWVRRGWMVQSVEETDRVEEVFCATVEGTHNFALEDNILTGNCFGCQAKGDVISFVREIEHLDFVAAVEKLAGRAKIELRYDNEKTGSDRKHRQVLVDAMNKAVAWYHERLLSSPDAATARGYLRNRGLNGEIARQFQIGWAPDGWDELSRSLRLPENVLKETGLGFVNRRGRTQDAFRGRVLFPIFDVAGNAIAIGGRILPGADGPKYKNSSETPLYAKSRTLYALNWSKTDIVQQNEVIVCEGYTDVIAFYQAGMPRAVATCGTALTEEHIRTMKNFSTRVVLAYDADGAGQEAAARVYEWEQKLSVDFAVAALPKGLDPADAVRRDPEILRAAVRDAMPYLQFRIERTLDKADLRSVEGRARAAGVCLEMISEHPNQFVRDQYLMLVADRCRVPIEHLRDGVLDAAKRSQQKTGNAGEQVIDLRRRNAVTTNIPRVEEAALRLAVQHPEDVAALFDSILPDGFPAADALAEGGGAGIEEALFEDIIARAAFRALIESPTLRDAIESAEPEAAELLSRLAVDDGNDDGASDEFIRLIDRSANRWIRTLDGQARSTLDGFAKYGPSLAWLKLEVERLRVSTTEKDAATSILNWLLRQGELIA
jgi:DNA primase